MDEKELDTAPENVTAENAEENAPEEKISEADADIVSEENVPDDESHEADDGYTPAHYAKPQDSTEGEIVIYENDEEKDEEQEEGEYSEDDEENDEFDEEEEERARRREELKRKKRRKKTHGRLIFALIMVTLVISVSVLGAVAVITVAKEILGLDRSDTEFSVEIPNDSGTEAIANLLTEEGIITNPTLFRVVSKVKGADGTYIAGVHKLKPNMTYGDVIEALQEEAINPREFVEITFPEGIRLIDAAAKLEEAGVCSASDFIRTFNSTTFGFDFEKQVKASAKKFYKMEGYFFPDTYQFYLEEDPKNVVKKVFKNYENKVTPNHYGRMNDIDMTLEEVMTLASIVQAEAAYSSDMKMVASVFLNRLNNPDTFPLLQSDPTTNYAEEVIAPNMEVYSQSICDAYDTYKGGGLPPGPICNPGIEAIEAVLYPRETDYFFFCSDLETGEFFYAETLEEHEANLIAAHLVAAE